MERNLDRRVEVLTPVIDEDIRKHLKETVLISYLKDTERAMVLDSTGRYVRPEPTGSDVFDSQQHLLKHYEDNSAE
jgi:polyphosphate kinase